MNAIINQFDNTFIYGHKDKNEKELDMRKIERITPIPIGKEFVLWQFFWLAVLCWEGVE